MLSMFVLSEYKQKGRFLLCGFRLYTPGHLRSLLKWLKSSSKHPFTLKYRMSSKDYIRQHTLNKIDKTVVEFGCYFSIKRTITSLERILAKC